MNKVIDSKERNTSKPPINNKQAIRHVFTYGLGTAMEAAAAFLVTPILAHNLLPREYGVLELLNRSAAVVCALLGSGLCQAYYRFYLDREDSVGRGSVVTLVVGATCTALSLMVLIVSLLSPVISRTMFGSEQYSRAVILSAFTILATLLFMIGTSHIRATLRSQLYVMFSGLNGVGIILGSWLAVSVMKGGLYGALIAPLVVSSILGMGLVADVWRKHSHIINKQLAKDMLRFALPFLPSAVFAWALHNVDRYFINMWCSPAAVGVYSLGYKLGFSVSMVSEPVMRLWTPYALSCVKTPGRQMLLGQYISYVFAVLCATGLAISLFSSELVRLVSPSSYWGASSVVPVVAAAYAVWGVCSMSDIGIIISKRTIFKPFIFLAACVVNIVGNIIFVPKLGSIAAAWTTLAGMIVFYTLQACITRRIYPIGLRPVRMLFTFLLGVLTYVGACGQGISIRVLMLLVYIIAMGLMIFASMKRLENYTRNEETCM